MIENNKSEMQEEKVQSSQNRLNLVVGILTVFQVAGVIFEFTQGSECGRWLATIITFVIGFILLYIVISWDNKNNPLVRLIGSIFYRGRGGN